MLPLPRAVSVTYLVCLCAYWGLLLLLLLLLLRRDNIVPGASATSSRGARW